MKIMRVHTFHNNEKWKSKKMHGVIVLCRRVWVFPMLVQPQVHMARCNVMVTFLVRLS